METWPDKHPEHLRRMPSLEHAKLLHTISLTLQNDPSPATLAACAGILMAAFDPSVEVETVDLRDEVKQRLGWPQADLDRIEIASAVVFHYDRYVLTADVMFLTRGKPDMSNSVYIREAMFDSLMAKGWDISESVLNAELTNDPDEQARINARRNTVADDVVAKFRAEMDATFQTWEGGEHGTHRGGTGDGSAGA